MGHHLTLRQRKVLAAKLRVVEALEPHRAEAYACDFGEAFEQLQVGLLVHAKEPLGLDDAPTNELPLDRFVQDLATSADAVFRALPASSHGLLQAGLTALQQGLRAVSCSSCNGTTICSGYPAHDNPIVDQKGHCIEPFLSYFRFALDETRTCYAAACPRSSAIAALTVDFATEYQPDPSEVDVAPALGADVQHSPGAALQSRVRLLIDVPQVDLECCHVAPYVLFHELVCHAFHAIDPPVARRDTQREDDCFAEGWMDWVAFQLCERTLSRLIAGVGRGGPSFTRAHLDLGSRLRAARQDLNSGNAHTRRRRGSLRIGTRAAQLFHGCISEVLAAYEPADATAASPRQQADRAWELFLQISLKLNRLSGQTERKDRFARWVYTHLHVPAPPSDPRPKTVRTVLHYYLAGGERAEVFLEASS